MWLSNSLLVSLVEIQRIIEMGNICRQEIEKRLTFATSNADPAGFNLEAEATLIFPKGSSDPGLHARRRLLASGIKPCILILHGILASYARQGENVLGAAHGV